MINLSQYAAEIQSGLNAVLAATDLAGGYEFSVISDIRRYKKARRTGNNVVYYINCILTNAPGANGTTNGSGIEMAVDNLTLRVLVPLERLKADPTDDPDSWQDGVNVFVAAVKAIVDGYFQLNRVTSYTTADGKTFSVGFAYTLSATGTADKQPVINDFIEFSVYIEMYFVQNGINSLSSSLEIDGELVPFQVLTPNRAPVQDVSVKSADEVKSSRTLTSSTTLAFDVALPAVKGLIADQFTDFLLSGKTNVAHFIRFSLNGEDGMSRYYVMTYSQISANIQGTRNIGLTMPLTEQAWYPEIIEFPDYMQVTELVFDSPTATVSFTVGADGIIAFGGDSIASYAAGTTVQTHVFTPAECFYREDENDPSQAGYHAYIVACPLDKTSTAQVVQDVQQLVSVSGTWKWNDDIVYTGEDILQAVNAQIGYVSADPQSLTEISVQAYTAPSSSQPSAEIAYTIGGMKTYVYMGSWSKVNDYAVINFGNTPQYVTEEFYSFLTANAQPKDGLNGVWKFNEMGIHFDYDVFEYTQTVADGTTIGGTEITAFIIQKGADSVNVFVTPKSGGSNITVCVRSVWLTEDYGEVDFGQDPQIVSDEFYTFMTENAVKQS